MRNVLLASFLLAAACAHEAESDAVKEAEREVEIKAAAAHFICSGTEPFWSLELKEGEAILRMVTMEAAPEQTEFSGGWVNADGASGVYEWSGKGASGRAFDVSVTKAVCLGTRDEPYAYTSSYGTARIGGEREPGCCERRN